MLVKYANFGRLCAVLLLLQTFVPQAADAKKSGGKTAFLAGALTGVVGGGLLGHIMTKQMQQQQQPIAQQQHPANPPPPPPPVPQFINQPPLQPMQTQFSYPAIQQQQQPAQAWQPSYSYPVDQSSVQHGQPVQSQFPLPAAPQLPAPVQQPAVEQHPYGWDPSLVQPSAQPAQSAGQYSPYFQQPVIPHLPAPAPAPVQPATYPSLQPDNSHDEQSAGHHTAQPGQTQFLYPPLAHLPESAQPQPSQAAAQKPSQPEHSQPAHPAIENVSESAHHQSQPTQQPAERSLLRTIIEKLHPHNSNEEQQPPKDTQNPQSSGIQDSFLNIKTSVDQPHAPSQQQYPPQQPAQYSAGQTAPASAAQAELPAPIVSQQQPVVRDVSSHVQVPAQPGVAPAWHAPAAHPAAAIGGTPIQPGQLAFPTPTPIIPPAQPTEDSSWLSKKKSIFSKSAVDKTQQTNFVLMMSMFFLLLWFRE
ncbi:PREDICTED: RNA-binding protein 33-like [Rhagoletis zephyria]|uniref:RNA-binding protein 33-like n=1 Tax=Rhagoletis zephyria TaxID=28612 RepID=UPI00081196B9|nr:PREDICTED: RNA-binding protein 33-like [Rhagoletis zephyria]